MQWKKLAILSVVALTLGMTGCGSSTEDKGVSSEKQSTEKKQTAETTQSTEKTDQEVLHLWHYWDSELQQNLLQEMVDNYEKETNGF